MSSAGHGRDGERGGGQQEAGEEMDDEAITRELVSKPDLTEDRI